MTDLCNNCDKNCNILPIIEQHKQYDSCLEEYSTIGTPKFSAVIGLTILLALFATYLLKG